MPKFKKKNLLIDIGSQSNFQSLRNEKELTIVNIYTPQNSKKGKEGKLNLLINKYKDQNLETIFQRSQKLLNSLKGELQAARTRE